MTLQTNQVVPAPLLLLLLLLLSSLSAVWAVSSVDPTFDGVVKGQTEDETTGDRFPELDGIANLLRRLLIGPLTDKCRTQMMTYANGLKNSSLWAVQMLDASAKIPGGLLTSDAYDLGNYDGCLEINLKRSPADNIFGKYCLARLTIPEPGKCQIKSGDLFQSPEMSTFKNLIVPILKYGFINNALRLGICVPHECTSHDLKLMLGFLYENVLHCGADISVPENACRSAVEPQSRTGSYLRQSTLGLFVGVVIVTILDVARIAHKLKLPAPVERYVLPFSAYRNYNQLFASDKIPALDSLRVYALILLTMSRRFDSLLRQPLANRLTVGKVLRPELKDNFLEMSEDLVVGTILIVAGFLHCRKIHRNLRVTSSLGGLWRTFCQHYIKLLPLFVTVAILHAYAYDDLGDGPLWNEQTEIPAKRCRQNFNWDVTNFAGINETCIFEWWYLAVIAHYFLILPFIVRVTMTSSTTGLTGLGLVSVTAFAIPIQLMLDSGNVRPVEDELSGGGGLGRRLNNGTIGQAFSYFVGATAYVLYEKLKRREWQMSSTWAGAVSISMALICPGVLSISSCHSFTRANALTSLLVGKSRQLIWSLAVSWIIIRVSTNDGSCLTPFLKHRYLSFFASFTYPYILILGFVQRYTSGTVRTLEYFSFPRLVWMSAADLASTYIFAFVFYMILHKPIGNILESALFKKVEEEKRKTTKAIKRKSKTAT